MTRYTHRFTSVITDNVVGTTMRHSFSIRYSTISSVILAGVVAFQVTSVQAEDGCEPNYADVCVPIASDVDCAGGSGNGPYYVGGPVYVVGSDIYGLDRDGDGIGCE